MKKFTNYLMVVLGLSLVVMSCKNDDPAEPVPVAPIIKEVAMPAQSQAIPGSTIRIQGKGFDPSDTYSCKSLTGDPSFEAVPAAVDKLGVEIVLPDNAAGTYEVSVTRSGLVSVLSAPLKVPYLVVIKDLVMPTGAFKVGAQLSIGGEGFEVDDQIEFISDIYPEGVALAKTVNLTEYGVSLTVPEGAYGVNQLVIRRGIKQNTLGKVNVAVEVGDELGGGVVFYVSDGGVHGLIAKKSNVGTAAEQWGPTSLHGGTKKEIYSGKENTRLCVEKMVGFHQQFETWPLSKKSAAELCDAATEVVAGVTYDDWFLPSQLELIELFKVKAMLEEKGAGVAANNYWSSSEGDGDAAGWSAFYVNFYEETTVVSNNSDKEGWKIGIRPVRQF